MSDKCAWSRKTGLGTKWLLAFLLLVFGASVAMAQLPTATILGEVKDSSGGVMAGAKVTARNVDTGQSREDTTGSDGSYHFNALAVGNYEARVEQSGFQTAVRSGLTLTVGQEAVVNFSLDVGSTSQTVEVSAEAPLVNTTSGSLGGLVTEEKVADLPLNGRNYIDLALLQPGITIDMNRSAGEATWYSANGATPRSNYYMLDGTPTRNLYGTNPSSQTATALGVDGVKEYSLVTNAMSAEYGMSMGSEMVVVSKNGTNAWHGDAFEYFRSDVLDARNFFDYGYQQPGGRRIPAFTRNQFGGSIGGPIQKDKTFLYLTYESLHARTGTTQLVNTVGAGCFGPANAVITNTACPQLGNTASVTIAPVIAPILALFPVPNLPGNTYTFGFTSPQLENFGQARIDHTFSANDSLFIRFTTDDANETYYSQPFPQYTDIPGSLNTYVTLGETHIFSPNLLNTARFSWAGTRLHTLGPLPYTGAQYSLVAGLPMGQINVGGLGSFGPDGPLPINYNQYVWTGSDDVFYTHGKHSLKFGTLINNITMEPQGSSNIRGILTFNTIHDPVTDAVIASPMAAFLQGYPSTEQALTPGSKLYRTYNNWTYGFYGEDDWRVTSRLTLNLGLRYEFQTLPQDVNGLQASIRNPLTGSAPIIGPVIGINNSLHNFGPRIGFAWDVFGDGKTALRGGFAQLYDISNIGGTLGTVGLSQPPFSSSSTVNLNSGALTTQLALPLVFPASAAGTTLNMEDYDLKQPSMEQFNLTIDRQMPWHMALTVSYAGSLGRHIIDSSAEGNPLLPEGTVTTVGGVQSCSPGTNTNPNLTSMVYGSATACWGGTDSRVNQNVNPATGEKWGHIAYRTADGNSSYNSLQVQMVKQMTHGVQFQSSYTWSKSLDEVQNQLASDQTFTEAPGPTNAFNLRTDRGPSVFNSQNNWHFNLIYHVPSPIHEGFAGTMLGGWWVAAIETLQSGYPFTACLSNNQSGSKIIQGAGSPCADRPNLVPGRSLSSITSGTSTGCTAGVNGAALTVAKGTPLGTPNLWFDPCAFTVQPAGFLGTEGRNILNGPAFADTDFTVAKDTKLKFLGESGNLEFRVEMFNLLNHANFQFGNNGGGAALEIDTPSAGQLLDTADTSRQIQLALKLLF
jgi:hypothetical protein